MAATVDHSKIVAAPLVNAWLKNVGAEVQNLRRHPNFTGMETVKTLWRGDLGLSEAFWNWAVLGALLVNVPTTLLFLYLITADHTWPALIVGHAFSIPFNLIALVGV